MLVTWALSAPASRTIEAVLRLRVAPSNAVTPVVPAPDEPGVEVWRHTDGTIIAFGGSRGAEHWMQLVNVGLFVFGEGAAVVTAFPEPDTARHVVEDGYRRAVLPMALQVLGVDVLHASAVLAPTGVVAFCAVSETGKSTVAYALARRGYPIWADDAVAFKLDGEKAAALPLVFSLRLRPPTQEFYGEDGADRLVAPERSERLAAICLLERVEDDDRQPAVESLKGADAFSEVLPHAYCFSLADEARKRRMAASYLELVDHVPVFRVRLRSGLEQLEELLGEIEDALGLQTSAA